MDRRRRMQLYWKMQSVVAPGLKYSQTMYEDVLTGSCNDNPRWLDLGCGHSLLPPWRHEQEQALVKKASFIVGIDADFDSLTKHKTIENRVCADIGRLPFADGSFDLITSNMVFEHLKDPEVQLKETARVLAPNGVLIVHTPNIYSYTTILARMIPESIKGKLVYFLQRRKDEDLFPAYYRINSPASMRRLSEKCGLKVVKIKMVCSSAQLTVFPPAALFELVWLRFLMTSAGRKLRNNMIAIMQKI